MTTQTQSRMKLQRLRIQNYMAVELAEMEPAGKNLKITGRNGSGKSSLIKGWMDLIRGHNKRDGAEPVHEGADRAILKADLGDIIIERTITPDGAAKLKVSASDGSAFKRPQEMLDSLIGPSSIDPCAFLRQRPRDQVDQVLKICGVKCPEKQVEEITGERFPAKPGEPADAYLQRLGGDEIGVFYVRRREAGRVAESKRHAVQEQEQALLDAGGVLREGEGEQSATEIYEELDELGKVQDERKKLGDAAIEAEDVAQEGETLLGTLIQEQADLNLEIVRLRALLDEKKKKAADLESRITLGRDICAERQVTRLEAEKAWKSSADPSMKIAALRSRLKDVETVNKSLRLRQTCQDQFERFREEAGLALEEHQRLEGVLEALRMLRSQILQGTKLGIPGLEVGDGELRLNSKPFHTQASSAEQVDVACAIAMIPDSILRVIAIDGGESLDLEMLGRVIQRAGENGYQVVWSEVDRAAERLSFEIVESST